MPREPTISELAHEIQICSAKDVVEDGDLQITREGVLKAWAKVEERKATAFGANGMAIKDDRDVRTHLITVHFREDIDITAAAWIYEKRGRSLSRWFKILNVGELHKANHWFIFDCRLIERAENSTKPTVAQKPVAGNAVPLPADVML